MTEPAGTPANAVRTTSKTGGAKDVKIERFDQIPAGALAELAARYGIGSLKYPQVNGLDNWRNGYPWSYSYRALVGHANAFWAGEDVDPAAYLGTDNESAYDDDGNARPGVMHLAAVAWHALALLHWAETHPEYDDRESTVLARQAAGLSATEDADTPCQEPEICRSFAACSLECEQRYAREDEFGGLDVHVNPNIPEGHVFIAPLRDAEEQVKLFTYPKTIKLEDLYHQGGWMDVGLVDAEAAGFGQIIGDLRLTSPNGQPIRPQLELDDRVTFVNTASLAFATDEYGTVVGVRRDGLTVKYDVRISGSGLVVTDLTSRQLIKQ